jgi:hypothetical protein
MNDYEAKQEARRERLEARAERLSSESSAVYRRVHDQLQMIPMGQPILVGHHSERGHRAHLRRIDNGMRRSCELDAAAKDAARRAAAVGSGGISSDDPDAVSKLREELAKCEKVQASMVAANKVIRAFYKAGYRDANSGPEWPRYLEKLRAAMGFEVSEGRAVELLKPDFCGRIGFADFETKNNGANVRRLKGRIAELERLNVVREAAADSEPEEFACAGYVVVKNVAANRVQLRFPGKPPSAVRDVLKRSGFRWSPSECAWQRMLNASAMYGVAMPEGYIRKELEALLAKEAA